MSNNKSSNNAMISFAAIINAEASRVVATMRQNSKYAILARQTMSSSYGSGSSAASGLDIDESLVDDPLVQEFMSLRRALFVNGLMLETSSSSALGDFGGGSESSRNNNNKKMGQQPLSCADFIRPFLKCIVSVETSGPITSQALSAVHKILKRDLIFGSDDVEKAVVVRDISEAVTMSRFEATDPDHDDAVLCKILHVLIDCVACPSG